MQKDGSRSIGAGLTVLKVDPGMRFIPVLGFNTFLSVLHKVEKHRFWQV